MKMEDAKLLAPNHNFVYKIMDNKVNCPFLVTKDDDFYQCKDHN